MKYWIQVQAPAGNWVDVLGTDDLNAAAKYAMWQQNHGPVKARVIERKDEVLYDSFVVLEHR